MSQPFRGLTAAAAAMIASVTAIPLLAQTSTDVLEGAAAFGDWHADRPGTRRLIRPQDLPPPDLSASASNFVRIVRRADDQKPIVPNGFDVNLFASGLTRPRLIRVAPNGDVFAAESGAGQIRVLRPNGKDAPKDAVQSSIFASGLHGPFGIAFYPSGADPQWVYIGNTDSVVRFPYRNGDLVARGAAEIIVPRLPTGGHITRDVAFSPDGQTMYVSVGSEGNVGDDMGRLSAAGLQKWQTEQPLGAARGDETGRADVLAFDPQGKNGRIFATGIRNCVGLAIEPTSGTPWCSTNERTAICWCPKTPLAPSGAFLIRAEQPTSAERRPGVLEHCAATGRRNPWRHKALIAGSSGLAATRDDPKRRQRTANVRFELPRLPAAALEPV